MKNLIITIIFLIAKYLSFICGTTLRNGIGNMIGRLGYHIGKTRREITLENLSHAFPEKSHSEIKSIAIGVFQSITITFLELFILDILSKKTLNNMIQGGDGLNLINNILSRGKGCLFLSGHFGNGELIAYSVREQTQLPITIIVKPQANSIADKYLNQIRTSNGNQIVSMYNAAKTIINVIRSNEVLALLTDQAATKDKDLFVDFFGRQASTFKVVAELALRYKVPIVMGFAVRQENRKYKADITEIDYTDLVIDEKLSIENVRILTERHTQHLENIIRKYPAQGAWLHRRGKYTPILKSL